MNEPSIPGMQVQFVGDEPDVGSAVDRNQIIYALQRAESSLRKQANDLMNNLDYNAQFFDEDADRMKEAIALITESILGVAAAPAELPEKVQLIKSGLIGKIHHFVMECQKDPMAVCGVAAMSMQGEVEQALRVALQASVAAVPVAQTLVGAAPGVAAEVMRLMDLVWNYAESFKDNDASGARAVWDKLETEISTALQASAAAVEPVSYQYRHYHTDGAPGWGTWRECNKTEYEMLLHRPTGTETRRLYTAPPPHAQVQAAEVTDQECEKAIVAHLNNGNGVKGMRTALKQFLASRTPAPALKNNVMSKWPFPIETEVSDDDLLAIVKRCGQIFQSNEARIMLMRAAIAADRDLRGAPGMVGGVVPSGLMALLVELQDAGYCDVDGDFRYTLPSAVREAVKAELAAPSPAQAKKL